MEYTPLEMTDDDPEMSDDERRHWDETNRMLVAATAETDAFIIAEYKLALERGENPEPPLLSSERDAIDQREADARRAAKPPYTGPIRHWSPMEVLYGFPDDVRDDEILMYNREHAFPWSYETELRRRAEDAKKKS